MDPPDNTVHGDWAWGRASYDYIQTALNLLQAKLNSWNTTAIQHGAIEPPYEREVEILKIMIDWAEPRFADPNTLEIVVSGITVESLRYLKAALLNAAWHFETGAIEQAKDGWPPRVLEAVRGRARKAHELAAEIKYQPADVLQDIRPDFALNKMTEDPNTWDVFVSHASEDKGSFVNDLAVALRNAGLAVWYDDSTLTIGDSLRRSIDKGLARSRFGVVILSPAFFSKEWPQRELDGLVAREHDGAKVLLPVWHTVDVNYVRRYSPTLADRLGISSEKGVDAVATAILQAIRK